MRFIKIDGINYIIDTIISVSDVKLESFYNFVGYSFRISFIPCLGSDLVVTRDSFPECKHVRSEASRKFIEKKQKQLLKILSEEGRLTVKEL